MRDVPEEKRGAAFICVVAIVFDSDKIRIVEGKIKGFISEKEMGKSGFGYDPVFYYPPWEKTFAQLTPDQKNKISHRAIAFKKAQEVLEKLAR
jgi:XTP/dITP diphosphohydrolase